MRGCVFKRQLPSGRITWGYVIDVGKDENGKRKQIQKTGFKRQGDAQTELNQKLHEQSQGELVAPDPRTFGELMSEYLKEHAPQTCSPKTLERYQQLAGYIAKTVGAVPLQKLTTLALEREYSRLRAAGGKRKVRQQDGTKTTVPASLSAKTVHNIAGLVHVALSAAVRWNLIKANPAEGAQLPKREKREAKALDPSQTDWFLDAARGSWLYPILVLAAATGCRRGELLALTVPDLNLDGLPPSIHISKSLEQTKAGLRIKPPKNGKPRTIPLPAIAVEALRAHLKEQTEFRHQFGPDYRADLNLVFASPEGEYLKPDSVTAKACLLARKAGLKGVGLHSLRHSHGSQLLSAGVPLPTVSKRLGHSSVNITAAVYSHAFGQDELAAADAWDSVMSKSSGRMQTMKPA